MKVEVDVLGCPYLIVLMVSVGVKHHERRGARAIVGEFHIHPPSPSPSSALTRTAGMLETQ